MGGYFSRAAECKAHASSQDKKEQNQKILNSREFRGELHPGMRPPHSITMRTVLHTLRKCAHAACSK